MGLFSKWVNGKGDPKDFGDIFPNRIYTDDAFAKESYTFFYDPTTQKLTYAPYPIVHNELIHGTKKAQEPGHLGRDALGDKYNPGDEQGNQASNRWDVVNAGWVVGRAGFLGKKSLGPIAFGKTPVIAIYGVNVSNVAAAVNAIFAKLPQFASPNTVIALQTEENSNKSINHYAKDIPGIQIAQAAPGVAAHSSTPGIEEPPECVQKAAQAFNLNGRPTSIQDILSIYHSDSSFKTYHGQDVCSQINSAKAAVNGCKQATDLIDDIAQKYNCGNNAFKPMKRHPTIEKLEN